MNFAGKKVLITAAQGIGRANVEAFSRAGVRVWVRVTRSQ